MITTDLRLAKNFDIVIILEQRCENMYHMWKEVYNTQKIENTDDLPTDSVQYTTTDRGREGTEGGVAGGIEREVFKNNLCKLSSSPASVHLDST